MRFESIRIHNLGPFRDVDIDLANAPGPLLAITGDNGAGKTTLLELLAAALYRETKTRGTLSELATARDASLEVHVVNGQSYTLRQTADAVKKRSEALILANGSPVLESSRVSDADAFVAAHFPRADVLYSTQFMPQKSAGFLELSRAERTRVMLWLLRIERYEAMAERAREHVRAAKADLTTARARLADASDRYPALEAATARETHAEQAVKRAQEQLQDARKALADAQGALAELAHAKEVADKRARLAARVTQKQRHIAELNERIENNHMLLARQTEINAACERHKAVQAELTQLKDKDSAAAAARSAAAERKRGVETALELSSAGLDRARERVTELQESVEDAKAVQRAVRDLPQAKSAVEAARAAMTVIETELSRSQKVLFEGKDARLGVLRGGLKDIAGGAKGPASIAEKTLTEDNTLARDAKAAPTRVEELERKLRTARKAVDRTEGTLRDVERVAARSKDLDKAAKQLAAATAALSDANTAYKRDRTAQTAVAAELEQLARGDRARALARKRLEASLEKAAQLAGYKPQLDVATGRIEELAPELERAKSELKDDQDELAALPVLKVATVDVATAEAAVQSLDDALAYAIKEHADARTETARAREGQEMCAELGGAVARIERDLGDWTRLSQDLGKDGLQALEIDAAIPELNAIANDLLHTCHGPRFTVEVFTDRLNADGTRTVEDLDVRVIDTHKGRDAVADTFSGGEQVILSEAISLALTVLACRRSGLTRPTLVRDESGAALDPRNGPIYIAMLRRAAEAIGADKVLFVTHNPQLQDLADGAIHIESGTATITVN